MDTPQALIGRCGALGITLTANDGKLKVDSLLCPVSDDLRAELRDHKAAILTLLTPPLPSTGGESTEPLITLPTHPENPPEPPTPIPEAPVSQEPDTVPGDSQNMVIKPDGREHQAMRQAERTYRRACLDAMNGTYFHDGQW